MAMIFELETRRNLKDWFMMIGQKTAASFPKYNKFWSSQVVSV